jgi:hypothetical protein
MENVIPMFESGKIRMKSAPFAFSCVEVACFDPSPCKRLPSVLEDGTIIRKPEGFEAIYEPSRRLIKVFVVDVRPRGLLPFELVKIDFTRSDLFGQPNGLREGLAELWETVVVVVKLKNLWIFKGGFSDLRPS